MIKSFFHLPQSPRNTLHLHNAVSKKKERADRTDNKLHEIALSNEKRPMMLQCAVAITFDQEMLLYQHSARRPARYIKGDRRTSSQYRGQSCPDRAVQLSTRSARYFLKVLYSLLNSLNLSNNANDFDQMKLAVVSLVAFAFLGCQSQHYNPFTPRYINPFLFSPWGSFNVPMGRHNFYNEPQFDVNNFESPLQNYALQVSH